MVMVVEMTDPMAMMFLSLRGQRNKGAKAHCDRENSHNRFSKFHVFPLTIVSEGFS
jgi:hypothetical protein